MPTITIPQKIEEEELIAVPRKEYEGLLKLRKIIPMFKLTPSQKRDLELARKEYKEGKYITLEKFEYELGITSSKI